MFSAHSCSRCPINMNRRSFMAKTCISAAALQLNILDYTSSLFAAETKPSQQATIRAVFVHPKVDKYWLGWPGAAYDIKLHQQQYTAVLREAAKKLAINLEVIDEPIYDTATVNTFLEGLAKAPVDGIVVTIMDLNYSWEHVNTIAQNRGKIPTVIFSPMGTSFTGHLQIVRSLDGVFLAATQDVSWLGTALKMLKTVWQMKNTRICIVQGEKPEDKQLEVIGTTLHYVPHARFIDTVNKIEMSDEMRAIADYYIREAKMIVEPTKDDILNAAKNYVVARRVMMEEKCDGFSIECLGPVGKRLIQPPCLANSRLNDEGIVGACEGDWKAAISMRLTNLFLDKPGFMQDPAPNTVNNTLMGAHCSCPTRLDGFDKPAEPFILRSHSESNLGVSMQILWRIGQRVTLMQLLEPGTMVLATGTVLRNIDTPPSGGCRTSVEVTMDDKKNTLDTKGFHQLFIYGDHAGMFKAYGKLAGIKVEPM